MSPVAQKLVEVLSESTPFAENIVRRQAERLGLDVDALPDTSVVSLVTNVRTVMKGYLEPTAFAVFEDRLRRMLPQGAGPSGKR